MNKEDFCFAYDVLEVFAKADEYEDLSWNLITPEFEFYNTLIFDPYFAGSHSPAFSINKSNLPLLKQCLLDVKEHNLRFVCSSLFYTRLFNRKPEEHFYKNFDYNQENKEKIKSLFINNFKSKISEEAFYSNAEQFYSSENSEFLYSFLRISFVYNCFSCFFYYSESEDDFLKFSVNCSDFFIPAGDAEYLTKDNIDLLEKSCKDIFEIKCKPYLGPLLFVARVRKELYWKHERAFGSNPALQQLFIDAAK